MDWNALVPSRAQWRASWRGYLGGLAVLAVALLLQYFTPVEYRNPASPWLYLAVLITAMFWGLAPSFLVAEIAFVVLVVWWIPPPQRSNIAAILARFVPFALITMFATWMTLRLKGQAREVAQQLKEQERHKRQFQAIADTAPVLMWVADESKGCTWFNKRWLEFTGTTMESQIGDGWANGVHPDDLERCLRMYHEAFDARRPFHMEYRLRGTNGHYCSFVDEGAPFYLESGAFLGYVGALMDMSVRKEAERVMEGLLNEKHNFIAVMSHELRTPLTGIMGYTDMMLEEIPAPLCDEHREWASAIKELSEKLRRLIEGILDFSKVQQGHATFISTDVDIVCTMREITDEFRPLARKRGIAITMDHTFAPDHLYSDPMRVREIMHHLVKNAISFTKKGGVAIRAMEAKGYLVLTVKDTGAGISQEEIHLIFEPFHQVRQSFAREVGGMGLGLAQCRTLAEALGGTLEATSEGAGKGATFTLRLPVMADEAMKEA